MSQDIVAAGRPDDAQSWDSFVHNHPHGSVFHTMPWQRMITNSFGHEPRHIVARSQNHDHLLGVLPLFLVRSRIFGRLLVSTPQAAYGGILATSDAVEKAIFARAAGLAKELDVEFLELRTFRNGIVNDRLLERDLYVTFRQEIFENSKTNLLSIPRKTRAEIREGIKNGLEFRVDQIGAGEFFKLYSRSVRDLGTPVFPPRLFSNGLQEFGSNCKIFSVHWKGRLVSAVWTLFYKNEVVPYFGGSIREYNRLGVNNFMYWMLINYGSEHGYRVFDFGRSKKGTGSFDFKKRWGMTMSELPYQYALIRRQSVPDTSPLNAKFSLAIRTWRHLPLPLTRIVGPMISKHLI